MGHIQIRIADTDKKEAQKVLSQMGLTYSSAIKLFLKQVIKQQRLPFEISAGKGASSDSSWNSFEKRRIG